MSYDLELFVESSLRVTSLTILFRIDPLFHFTKNVVNLEDKSGGKKVYFSETFWRFLIIIFRLAVNMEAGESNRNA